MSPQVDPVQLAVDFLTGKAEEAHNEAFAVWTTTRPEHVLIEEINQLIRTIDADAVVMTVANIPREPGAWGIIGDVVSGDYVARRFYLHHLGITWMYA